jgi:hypothetical protein
MSDLTESHVALARIADALFCSELETGQSPTNRQLAAAIRASLKIHRNWDGCTRAVAAAFAHAPRAAEQRERWCQQLAGDVLTAADTRLDPGGLD